MNEPTIKTLTIPETDAGARLDKALATALPEMSRARLQGLITDGDVLADGAAVRQPSMKLKGGEKIEVHIPAAKPADPKPEAIALDIVFEDAHLLVVNKPTGLTVHPAPGTPDGTLVNALLAHCGDSLGGINGVERPGIVHRIDKDTSGLLVVAKTETAQRGLQTQFSDHSIKRRYTAFVWGVPRPATGTIEGNIGRSRTNWRKMTVVTSGGKPATTHYDLAEAYGDMASKLTCTLETGRTHQIRVHLTGRGHPLMGDPLYGKGRQALRKGLLEALVEAITTLPGQALHAGHLGFTHPATGAELAFDAPFPRHLSVLETCLRSQKV